MIVHHKIIGVTHQKGGVGKTTTTAALAALLARAGGRVLCIDLDPQSNLTQALGVQCMADTPTIYDLLLEPQRDWRAAILPTAHDGVYLIPATLDLAGAEIALAGRFGRELLLRTALASISETFDYVLIDSPPSLGLFTINALVAADTLLVPLQAHVFALQAMSHLDETIQIARQLNPALHIGGIVITMVDKRTTVNREVEAAARDRYGDLVFQTTIPFNVKLVEAPVSGQPITVYAPGSSSAVAYAALSDEVRVRFDRKVVGDAS